MLTMIRNYIFDTPVPRRAADCAVEEWLSFLGHRWNAGVLWHLSVAPLRFGALVERLPGITPKVLTERLQGLESRGLVTREHLETFPRGVTYALTREGMEIVAIIRPLEPWSKEVEQRQGVGPRHKGDGLKAAASGQ